MSFWNIPSIEPKLAYRWYISFGDRNIESQNSNALPHWVCKKVTKPSYQIKHTEHKYLGVHRFNYPTHLEWQPITLTLVDVYNFDQKKFEFTKERKDIDLNITNNVSVNNNTREKTNIGELVDQTITANRSTQLFFYYFLKEAGYIDPNEGIYQDLLARFTQTLTKRKMVGAFIGKNEDYAQGRRSDDPNNTYIDQNSWNTLDINEINEFGQVTEKWKLFNPLITSVKFGELAYETDGVVDISIDLVYDWAELVPTSYKDIDNPRNFKGDIRKEIENIEEQVIQEKEEKESIFNEIQKRYIDNEKALKESQLRLNKNNYFKNQKDIISKTFVEHKKYSNIKELRSDDRNEILRLKKEILDKEQLQDLSYDIQRKEVSINEAQKEIQLTEEQLRIFRVAESKRVIDRNKEIEQKRKEAANAGKEREERERKLLLEEEETRKKIEAEEQGKKPLATRKALAEYKVQLAQQALEKSGKEIPNYETGVSEEIQADERNTKKTRVVTPETLVKEQNLLKETKENSRNNALEREVYALEQEKNEYERQSQTSEQQKSVEGVKQQRIQAEKELEDAKKKRDELRKRLQEGSNSEELSKDQA